MMPQLRTIGRLELDMRSATADGIPCVLATDAPINRGNYKEVLDHAPTSIDLTRAEQGLALLMFHDQSRPVGRIEAIKSDGRALRGMARFGSSPEARQALADVEAGILPALSVGYRINESAHETGGIVRVLSWEPLEASIVPVPADIGAGLFRNTPSMENTNMQTNHTEVENLCRAHAVPDAIRVQLIADNATPEVAKAAILNHLAARDAGRSLPRFDTGAEQQNALADAIAHRMGVRGVSGDNRPMVEIAASSLEASGVRVDRRWSRQDLMARALSTSDFTNLLASGMGKALMQAYATTAPVLKAASRKVTLPDFRDRKVIRVGGTPDLQLVGELGEYTYSYVSDAVAAWKLLTYGRIIGLSRQALVNDDLGGFNDLVRKFGESAARKEADVLAALITSNPTVDALPMFDAGRGTQTTGAISVASLGAAIKLLRMQKEIDGGFIAAEPAFLIVPAALEMIAKQYTSADFVSAKSSDINPFKGTLEVIVEPRLDANSTTAWYLATAGGEMEHGYLDGQEGIYIETRNGFEVDGMEIKARLDFGAGFVAPTGWVKSTGV
jgi:HK97 family phage prohead protease